MCRGRRTSLCELRLYVDSFPIRSTELTLADPQGYCVPLDCTPLCPCRRAGSSSCSRRRGCGSCSSGRCCPDRVRRPFGDGDAKSGHARSASAKLPGALCGPAWSAAPVGVGNKRRGLIELCDDCRLLACTCE